MMRVVFSLIYSYIFFFFKQKTAYEMRISDWSSDVCSSDLLRLEPPSHGLFRTTMREVQLGGKTLPAHAQICVLFASANGDDSVFGCPRSLDLARGNSGNHLTFGAGIHRCIGASLARMELRVAAEEIIRRLDHIKLTIPVEEITYLPSLATHTIARPHRKSVV